MKRRHAPMAAFTLKLQQPLQIGICSESGWQAAETRSLTSVSDMTGPPSMAGQDRADNEGEIQDRHAKHQSLHHYVFVVGSGLIAGGMEFLLVWPENHHYALLGLAATLSLVTIYEAHVFGWDINWIVAGVFFWFVAAQILNGIIGPITELPPQPTIGWLQPANEPTPSNACGSALSRPTILIGDNALVPKNPETPFPAVKIGACPPVTIQRGPNGIVLNAVLYFRSGEPIGTIRDNGYVVTGEKRLIVEKSGDLSTLVIHDAEGQELLYARYLNPTTIRLRGIFACPTPFLTGIKVTNEKILGPLVTLGGNCSTDATAGVQVGQ